ncbi:MAG: hypothetical protein AAF415_12945 [Pseudomonadota bacterium]
MTSRFIDIADETVSVLRQITALSKDMRRPKEAAYAIALHSFATIVRHSEIDLDQALDDLVAEVEPIAEVDLTRLPKVS